MLRSFRLGNHRSFRDEQELLLMPVYGKDREVLPVAAIYGANASGKSNLLDGLKFMADAVRDSFARWRPGDGVPRRLFKLDPAARERPSVFVAEFVADGVRYTYGFEVDDRRVLAEWLYSYPEKRKRVLFDRSRDRIKFGKEIARSAVKVEVLEELLRPDALFLSLAAQFNTAGVLAPYRWFVAGLRFRLGAERADLAVRIADLMDDSDLRNRLVELLRAADFGVVGVELTADAGLPTAGDWLTAIQDLGLSPAQELDATVLRKMADAATAAATDRTRRVGLVHGGGALFELEEESAGTRSWLGLLPDVLRVLHHGGVLVIDEIDASLHSTLTTRLVALFNDAEANLGNGQLVFTTHDATLLHPPLADEVLERDQIWFVEKDRDTGASTLYPLSDFKPRREDNIERRYLAGQYGAVPNIYGELFVDAVRSGGHGEARKFAAPFEADRSTASEQRTGGQRW